LAVGAVFADRKEPIVALQRCAYQLCDSAKTAVAQDGVRDPKSGNVCDFAVFESHAVARDLDEFRRNVYGAGWFDHNGHGAARPMTVCAFNAVRIAVEALSQAEYPKGRLLEAAREACAPADDRRVTALKKIVNRARMGDRGAEIIQLLDWLQGVPENWITANEIWDYVIAASLLPARTTDETSDPYSAPMRGGGGVQ
jgi:hypothetical protein